jgi:hypothetical protein
LYETDDKGKLTALLPLGLAIGSPDVRRNAPCLDGHTVYAQYFSESIINWLTSMTTDAQKKRLKLILKKAQEQSNLKKKLPLIEV